uniref:Uncharacterized protein n=1 Tax=Parascaris univalens TaxID=6257 RepID=A0A915A529_PARUN
MQSKRDSMEQHNVGHSLQINETPRCLSKWAHMKFSEAPESTRLQDIPFMVTAQWFV